MLVQADQSQQPQQPMMVVSAKAAFKDTFWGQVMVGVITAVITAYLTAALVNRQRKS